MPLGIFEGEVLRLLARHRNPDSYVAGATVLHQATNSPRSSQDVDLFHDDAVAVAVSAEADLATLGAAGYAVEVQRPQEGFIRAFVSRGQHRTKIEWVHDSAFRFFPVEPDAELGWRLNFWDAATNKLLAFAARMKLRDYLDVMFLHERHLHVGALAWAAAGKDPGLNAEWIIDWGGRQARLQGQDVSQLRLSQPVDLRAMRLRWMQASEEALALIDKLPVTERGCLYLDAGGKPVCPDPSAPEYPNLTRHYGSVKGAWPRIVET
jgi:hypothetical protein